MIWHARMELWLAAMSCYLVAQGKPENLAPKDEPKFRVAGNLFRGAVISALHSKYEKSYISCASGKDLWDALEAKFRVSMRVVSYTSWSSCLTKRWFRTVLWLNGLMRFRHWLRNLSFFYVHYLTSLWSAV
jgi:hypothetical protein